MLSGDPLALGRIHIRDRHDLDIGHLGVGRHMPLADLPDADHSDLDCVRHA